MKILKKGFTLIELLIVIALLGTLAVALLAALDPLEQIKKGNDTGVRNTAAEIHGAFVRYSALQGGEMPFVSGETVSFAAIGTTGTTPGGSALVAVIAAGELKSDFVALSGKQLNNIFITGINTAGVQVVNVCYAPTAKSFKLDTNTKFKMIAGDGSVSEETGCPAAGGVGTYAAGATCYWCVR